MRRCVPTAASTCQALISFALNDILRDAEDDLQGAECVLRERRADYLLRALNKSALLPRAELSND